MITINSKDSKNNKKLKTANKSSYKFLVLFFGFFITIAICNIIYKFPIHITNYSSKNITKITIEGKSTNEYLTIEDKDLINSTIRYFDSETFVRQNLGTKYLGYNISVTFYSNNTVIDSLTIHSDNLLQRGSMVYKARSSKALKKVLSLLDNQFKIKFIN